MILTVYSDRRYLRTNDATGIILFPGRYGRGETVPNTEMTKGGDYRGEEGSERKRRIAHIDWRANQAWADT